MDGAEMKKNCAKAALGYIQNNTVIGLGGGSTISHLIDLIRIEKLDVRVVTPSFQTKMRCLEKGLHVIPTFSVDRIAIAFDGCDEVDAQLHALKSGGGIHTKEKLIGTMADTYILLADESKFAETLAFKHPVCLEILEDALSYVEKEVRVLGGEPCLRRSNAKDGITVSDYGHLLMDVRFSNVQNIKQLDHDLNHIAGVVDTSLFVGVANKALIAGESGIRVVEKL
ncbi:ribose-5-phosphate isomerase [Weizmannia acidilactici]|uniref:Ribose 5-phosphate isomerase A n=1 Tax=Weizmannia acidilactici TaxID=2607726 RepID=A0A5J4JHP8_9BACI|nr:ribose 5-phosphate isomerase A [Weizmannia acidilactici]GER67354.1 ribose-5-phosphate isomerase [Weizmannia acidilactici]GER70070.1 ribose-5-phosphate isomerase [Weizmannia acidilactici]GER74262.1 ribose-5-phosphate isomerase [Weizmannia acidilactici]